MNKWMNADAGMLSLVYSRLPADDHEWHKWCLWIVFICAFVCMSFVCCRVVTGRAPSLCGRPVTAVARAITATAMATPTASSPSPSAAPRSRACHRGTPRSVPPPSPPPTAVETTPTRGSWVLSLPYAPAGFKGVILWFWLHAHGYFLSV